MPPAGRRSHGGRAARRDELRGGLLEVIERLLDQGEAFADISVERLVGEAGISRSTFYVYFEDKSDLLLAWFAGIRAELEAAAQDWWSLGTGATRDDLHQALGNIVKAYRPHTTLMAAVYDSAAYDPAVRELVDSMMSWNIAGLRKHIAAGQQAGFVSREIPGPQTAAWLMWMAERGLHQLVRTASDDELGGLVDAYTAIVWNTLYAPCRRPDDLTT